jgi:hypothetical protein
VPLTVAFRVINSATIARLTLVDARTVTDIEEVGDGDVFYLGDLPTRRVNLRADADPGKVGSVVFDLRINDNTRITQTENLLPYSLFGNVGLTAAYNPYLLIPGTYRLTVTPYAEAAGKGAPGTPLSVTFTVARGRSATERVAGGETPFGSGPLTASPNPVRDQLTIHFAAPVTGEVTVTLHDVLGRQVYRRSRFHAEGQTSLPVDLSGLPGRLYLLRVQHGPEGHTLRIVKE